LGEIEAVVGIEEVAGYGRRRVREVPFAVGIQRRDPERWSFYRPIERIKTLVSETTSKL
jgi:hypothetical protein